MKKISLLTVGLLAISLVFTGCPKEAESKETEGVKTVEVTSVVESDSEVEVKGDLSNMTMETFVSEIGMEVFAEIAGLFNTENPDPLGEGNINAARAAITNDDFEKSFADLEEQFNKFSEAMDGFETTGSAEGKIDWAGPTGEWSPIEGIDASIEALYLKAYVSENLDTENLTATAKASASAKAKGSVSLKNIEGISTVKNAKANINVVAMASDLKAAGKLLGESFDETIDSVSGKIYLSGAVDSAVYFDTTNYNGVLKVTANAKVNQSLSKDLIKELGVFDNTSDSEESSGPTEEQLKALDKLISMDVTVNLYDVKGVKKAELLKINSASELFAFISGFALANF